MKLFLRKLFPGNDFTTIKNFRLIFFEEIIEIFISNVDFLNYSRSKIWYFLKKVYQKNVWSEFLFENFFQRNDFFTIKILAFFEYTMKMYDYKYDLRVAFPEMFVLPSFFFSTEDFLMKILAWNLFSRKWFCTHKMFLNKLSKFIVINISYNIV